MEASLVQRAGISYRSILAAGVHGVGLRAMPGNLARLSRGFGQSRKILREFQPEALLFTGGYVAVPMALAARYPAGSFKRPRSVVFVPDIEPGLAHKTIIRFSDVVALTVEQTRSFLPGRKKSVITGYPVRRDLSRWSRLEGRKALGLGDHLPVLLVTGGSKGARSINRAVTDILLDLLGSMQIVHVTGQLDWDEVQARKASLPEALSSRYHIFPYLHDEMGAALASADLVVSRSGASTLGEYPLFGLPAVLVPYPYAWRYQKLNADYLANHGAAVIVRDERLEDQLFLTIQGLMRDPKQLQHRANAMRSLSHPDAAVKIASLFGTTVL
jgi:UDP-N-acetylglucosamine--N-acetylmuramyl-(pentapeptide) pyrophosphoryl-undecaprenol N-acetylglucosamine transferase